MEPRGISSSQIMPCGELLKLRSLEPVSVGSVSVAAVLSFRLRLGRWSVLGVFQPEFHTQFAVSCPTASVV